MKTTLFSVVASLLLTFTAQAASVANYRIERSSLISGGKVKITTLGRGNGYRKVKLKYKLETSAGFKEDWIPYNFPEQMFDADFLAKVKVGQSLDLGSFPHGWERKSVSFKLVRDNASSFTVTSSDGKFRIFPRSSGSVWKRIEFTVKGLRIFGNLESVTNE